MIYHHQPSFQLSAWPGHSQPNILLMLHPSATEEFGRLGLREISGLARQALVPTSLSVGWIAGSVELSQASTPTDVYEG